jgi:hypothetical protein
MNNIRMINNINTKYNILEKTVFMMIVIIIMIKKYNAFGKYYHKSSTILFI